MCGGGGGMSPLARPEILQFGLEHFTFFQIDSNMFLRANPEKIAARDQTVFDCARLTGSLTPHAQSARGRACAPASHPTGALLKKVRLLPGSSKDAHPVTHNASVGGWDSPKPTARGDKI